MTLPNERMRSILSTRTFLRSLLCPKATPRVPKKIREEAYRCLRHFPWAGYLEETCNELPEIWGSWKEQKDNES